MASKLKRCPACSRKGWYRDQNGIHRCRYCGHNDALRVAAKRLQKTLDRGHRALGRAMDRERKK